MDSFKGVLAVDIETSSAADIKVGAWAYSLHESTRAYCVVFGYTEGRDAPKRFYRWTPGDDLPAEVAEFIRAGGTVIAHNCGFEKAVWTNILPFPPVDPDQWRDTQALGLNVNLPMTLAGLAKYLGCPVQKDTEGGALMKKMATAVLNTPAALKKVRPAEFRETLRPDPEGDYARCQDPDMIRRLTDYCETDVSATLDCYFRLPAMSVDEFRLWRVDQRVNARGAYLDRAFAQRAASLAEARAERLAARSFALTGGVLENSTNPVALKAYLKGRGVELPQVRKKLKGGWAMRETCDMAAIGALLEREDLDPEAREVLENRVEANKATSLAKLQRVPLMVGDDGRLRGALHYCGAHTGRWTSSGLQVHNLPKSKMSAAETDMVRRAIETHDLDLLELVHDQPLAAISQSLRSVICAAPGCDLIAADFASIEARVLAWLAGQQDVLDIFEVGQDVYIEAAKKFGSDDRQLGKVAVLALGYGMGPLKFAATGAKGGYTLPLKEWRRIQKGWREGNSMIVNFWRDTEDAARDAIDNPGAVFTVGLVRFTVRNNCLLMRLPSGRPIRYWRPHVVQTTKEVKTVDDEGNVKTIEMTSREIRFLTMAKDKSGMVVESTYSGKLVENLVQAASRDLLAEALVRVDATPPYETVVHVHDSIAAEVPEGEGSVEEFCALMAETPAWAAGLPMAVEGYRAKRFSG